MHHLLPWLIGILLFEVALYFHWRLDFVFVVTIFLIIIFRWLQKQAEPLPKEQQENAPSPKDTCGFQEEFLREKPPDVKNRFRE